jgi:excisionase family DNA binding protein
VAKTKRRSVRRTLRPQEAPASVDDLLTTEAAAKILGTTPGTLNTWRCVKRYPLAFIKVGRSVRYRRSDLLAFIDARRVA